MSLPKVQIAPTSGESGTCLILQDRDNDEIETPSMPQSNMPKRSYVETFVDASEGEHQSNISTRTKKGRSGSINDNMTSPDQVDGTEVEKATTLDHRDQWPPLSLSLIHI